MVQIVEVRHYVANAPRRLRRYRLGVANVIVHSAETVALPPRATIVAWRDTGHE